MRRYYYTSVHRHNNLLLTKYSDYFCIRNYFPYWFWKRVENNVSFSWTELKTMILENKYMGICHDNGFFNQETAGQFIIRVENIWYVTHKVDIGIYRFPKRNEREAQFRLVYFDGEKDIWR